MIREEKDGMVWLDCSMCGKMFPAYDADNGDMTEMLDEMYRADELRHCDACKRIIEEEVKRKKADGRLSQTSRNSQRKQGSRIFTESTGKTGKHSRRRSFRIWHGGSGNTEDAIC